MRFVLTEFELSMVELLISCAENDTLRPSLYKFPYTAVGLVLCEWPSLLRSESSNISTTALVKAWRCLPF